MESAEGIKEAILAVGNDIRQLKSEKAAKEAVDLKVQELLTLKGQYKNVTGEDYVAPGQSQGAKKEKKPKAAEAAAEPEGESKSAAKKAAKKAEKEAKKAAAAAAREAEKKAREEKAAASRAESETTLAYTYGDYPIIQSKEMTGKHYVNIESVVEKRAGQQIWVRAYIQAKREAGNKGIFLLLRQRISTIQSVAFEGNEIPHGMIAYLSKLPKESVVDVKASVTVPPEPVTSATQSGVELQVLEVHAISRAEDVLPLQVDDAGRNEEEAEAAGMPTVSQDTRLQYRWLDNRVLAHQAIFRVVSGVGQLFREFFINKQFVEIHSPKLVGGASEGGSEVFTLNYFGEPACLAQSPQLYKQMAAACSGFERVFEVGPVFRAENSNTHRHLCEFTGLDFEMAFTEHYHEVVEMLGELFPFIFDGLTARYGTEIELIRKQYPCKPLRYLRPSLLLTYKEGLKLLREAGVNHVGDFDDLDTASERKLGEIVSDRYHTDFYMLDKYPLNARPFYTMPDPVDHNYSNSYDMFIRGEEIVSGAQRIHDCDLLKERAAAHGIPLPSISAYLNAFAHGALPHAGGGIGLERVVMLYLGLGNIRKASLFPRDPKRISP